MAKLNTDIWVSADHFHIIFITEDYMPLGSGHATAVDPAIREVFPNINLP